MYAPTFRRHKVPVLAKRIPWFSMAAALALCVMPAARAAAGTPTNYACMIRFYDYADWQKLNPAISDCPSATRVQVYSWSRGPAGPSASHSKETTVTLTLPSGQDFSTWENWRQSIVLAVYRANSTIPRELIFWQGVNILGLERSAGREKLHFTFDKQTVSPPKGPAERDEQKP
jgi:hypothetical protein